MLCEHCSTPIPDGSHFCLNCGSDVSDPSTAGTGTLDSAGAARITRLLRAETAEVYEIDKEIGRGGMGLVFLATELELGRKVAIKVLPPELMYGDDDTMERFRREARTAAALDHPNIIPIHRVSSKGDLLWYAMKLLEGRTLADVLVEEGRLSLKDTKSIVTQVADALDYAHNRQVIHRDIKPGNIVLDDRGRVTVMDFGIAKELRAGSLTASGSLLGTPRYMSPEQWVGGELSGAADQYSLGIVVYEMLCGELPFEATSAYELLNKHCNEPPIPLAERRAELPDYVYSAVDRALAKKAEERFSTVIAFAEGLERPRADSAATVRMRMLASPESRSRKLVGWLAGAAAVVVAALGGWQIFGSGSGEMGTTAAEAESTLTAPAAVVATGDSGDAGVGESAGDPAQPEPPPSDEPASATQVATTPTAPARPLLLVRMDGPWATVFLDGVMYAEETRGFRDSLTAGRHELRFERPGYATIDTSVTLVAGEMQTLRIRMIPEGL